MCFDSFFLLQPVGLDQNVLMNDRKETTDQNYGRFLVNSDWEKLNHHIEYFVLHESVSVCVQVRPYVFSWLDYLYL